MGFEDEYQEITRKSWVEPLAQVNHVISKERKKIVTDHSLENHEYHMKKWVRCVYCDKQIPLEDTSIAEKKP